MKGGTGFKIPKLFRIVRAILLVLPSTVPLWVAAVGIAFGVFFGKGVFGGFGKNIFNPALVGRCFVFISFPSSMTVSWATPFAGFPGGFVRYTTGVDAISAATPLVQKGVDNPPLPGQIVSSGETSSLLILLARFTSSTQRRVATNNALWNRTS